MGLQLGTYPLLPKAVKALTQMIRDKRPMTDQRRQGEAEFEQQKIEHLTR